MAGGVDGVPAPPGGELNRVDEIARDRGRCLVVNQPAAGPRGGRMGLNFELFARFSFPYRQTPDR